MHIPDGYLSPQTCVALYAASAPFWYVATRRVKKALTGRMVPLTAMFAAFSFVIMMFNIPIPNGTTGHAVGGTLLAIILGPWAAVIGLSMALAVQALFFGDGGILAFGANAFNVAIVLPLVGYAVYAGLSGNTSIFARRRVVAAGIAGFVAINAAAFLTALEFGIQPALFSMPDGTPLYGPYGLDKAIPAMMLAHILVAGPVEGLVTALVVAYLQRANQPLLQLRGSAPSAPGVGGRLVAGPLWFGLAGLALLSPLGLLAAGTAWGEWGNEELRQLAGTVPPGLERFGGVWTAPLPAYSLPFLGNATVGYIISALTGMAVLVAVIVVVGRALVKREVRDD